MNFTELDLSKSMPRLRQRFPKLVLDSALCPIAQSDEFILVLATSQGISLTEAREEMRDFLYMESLRAELSLN